LTVSSVQGGRSTRVVVTFVGRAATSYTQEPEAPVGFWLNARTICFINVMALWVDVSVNTERCVWLPSVSESARTKKQCLGCP